MTTELIKRLRGAIPEWHGGVTIYGEAADALEAQASVIEQLTENGVAGFKAMQLELDAAKAEIERERDKLIQAIADHVTVRSEQHAEISKQAEALKLSRLALKAVKHAATEGYSYDFDCELFNTALAAINALEK